MILCTHGNLDCRSPVLSNIPLSEAFEDNLEGFRKIDWKHTFHFAGMVLKERENGEGPSTLTMIL
jgi:hypothetical protein